MLKKSLSILLTVVMLLSILIIMPISAFAEETDDIAEIGADEEIADVGLESTGYSALDNFISDYRFTHGASWEWNKRPMIASFGSQGCCAYCADYVKYCYGYNNPRTGAVFYSVSEIRAGDVLTVGNQSDGTGHWFVCLKRSGNSLYVAEGNVKDRVRIGWNYTISGNKFAEDSRSFTAGYHYLDSTPAPSNVWISVSRREIPTWWETTFTFGADNAQGYTIGIDRDGVRVITEDVSSGKTYTFNEPGEYSAYVTAWNSTGLCDSNRVTFTVYKALNLGQRFVAAIIHNKSGCAVTNDSSDNVVIDDYSEGDQSQLWLFEKIENFSRYRITNLKTGKCLDDYNLQTADGTNIQVWSPNNSEAQQWFIRTNKNGFSFVPVCAPAGVIDLYEGKTNFGNNITLYRYEYGNSNQIYSLKYMVDPEYTDTFNSKKYELFNTTMPWKEAYKVCEQKGGHLVTVNSKEEQDFVMQLAVHADNNRIWLGATDLFSEGKWLWQTGERMNYTNWADSEPNNDRNAEHFMMLYCDSGKWNDAEDSYHYWDTSYSFICEYENEVDITAFSLEKEFDYNDHRYEVYSNAVDWQTAERFCQQKGGHLVAITSAAENEFIANTIDTLSCDFYWIGLTGAEREGIWSWSSGEAFSYANWENNQPDNYYRLEDYIEINKESKKWNDIESFACTRHNIGFICEYDMIPILGDADGDGEVTSVDAAYIQRYNAMLKTGIDEKTLMNADVDGNGMLEIIDATFIQRHLAHMETPYRIAQLIV